MHTGPRGSRVLCKLWHNTRTIDHCIYILDPKELKLFSRDCISDALKYSHLLELIARLMYLNINIMTNHTLSYAMKHTNTWKTTGTLVYTLVLSAEKDHRKTRNRGTEQMHAVSLYATT